MALKISYFPSQLEAGKSLLSLVTPQLLRQALSPRKKLMFHTACALVQPGSMISSSKVPTAGLVGAAALLEDLKPLVNRVIGIALVMKILDLFQGSETIKDDPLASGLDKSENEFVAVYELGGGILVISILQFQKEMFQVKSIKRGKGDKYFDLALLWNAVKEFEKYTH
ncbi:hypothetical protein ACRRTK_002284 [Alexandromys fortis]